MSKGKLSKDKMSRDKVPQDKMARTICRINRMSHDNMSLNKIYTHKMSTSVKRETLIILSKCFLRNAKEIISPVGLERYITKVISYSVKNSPISREYFLKSRNTVIVS